VKKVCRSDDDISEKSSTQRVTSSCSVHCSH
jgi:hypothetical protein